MALLHAAAAEVALLVIVIAASTQPRFAHAQQSVDTGGASSCGVRYQCSRGSFSSDEYLMLRASALSDGCQPASHRSDLGPDEWLCGGYVLETKMYREILGDSCRRQLTPCRAKLPDSTHSLYAWSVGRWSGCSRACGGGARHRDVECRQLTAGPNGKGKADPVSEALCPLARPPSREACNAHSCHFCSAPDPCSGRGRCMKASVALQLPSRCDCNDEWGGKRCQIPLMGQDDPDHECRGKAVDSKGQCCIGPLKDVLGTCCAQDDVLDAKGSCCNEEDMDSCGVCGGKSVAVDNTGRCCPEGWDLDASAVCCPVDLIDNCGVCNGGGKSCTLLIDLGIVSETRIHDRSEKPGTAPVKPGASWQHLRDDLQTLLTLALGTAVQPSQMKLLDVESLEDATNATTAVLEELTALDAQYNYIMHPYSIKLGLPPKSVERDGVTTLFLFNSLQELALSVTGREPGTGNGLQLIQGMVVGPISFDGTCGNSLCEWGELTSPGHRFIADPSCPQDCPKWAKPQREFADSKGEMCSGRGRWVGTGEYGGCTCHAGYMGSRCEDCWLMWERHQGLPGSPCVPTDMKMYTLPLGESTNEPSRKIRAPVESRNAAQAQLQKDKELKEKERKEAEGEEEDYEEEEAAVNAVSRDARVNDEGIKASAGAPAEAMRAPASPPSTREEAMAAAADNERLSTAAMVELSLIACGGTVVLLLAVVGISARLKRKSPALPPSGPFHYSSSGPGGPPSPPSAHQRPKGSSGGKNRASGLLKFVKLKVPSMKGDSTNGRTAFDSPTGTLGSPGVSTTTSPTAVRTQARNSGTFMYPKTPSAGFYPKTPRGNAAPESPVSALSTPSSWGAEANEMYVEECGTPRTAAKGRSRGPSKQTSPQVDRSYAPPERSGTPQASTPTARKLGFGFGLWNKAKADQSSGGGTSPTGDKAKARGQRTRFQVESAADEADSGSEAPDVVPQFAGMDKMPTMPRSHTPRRHSGRPKSNLGSRANSMPESPEPQGLYPTQPPQEQQSPERRNTISLGWPGSLRFSNGPLGQRRHQTFNTFRTDVSESPMAMSEWGDSDYPDSSPEKSEYFASPDKMDHGDLDDPADPSSARKRPRGILTRTPQAPPSSVIQSRAVRFIEENNQSYPASPFAQSSRSMAALAATPSKGKAPLDLAAGDLVHYSADNMMSPTSAGSPMTPAGSRLLEEADQDLLGSPSLGLRTPSAQRGETFQVVLGTPGGLSAQQVVDMLMARGIRPDQVSIGGTSESSPASPSSSGPVPKISDTEHHVNEDETSLNEIEEGLPDEGGSTSNDEAYSTGDLEHSLSSDLGVVVRRLDDDGSDSSPDAEQQ